MKFFRHGVAALIIFAVLIGLSTQIYDEFRDNYGLTEGDILTSNITGTQVTGNIAEQLKSITIVEGISDIQAGISGLKTGTLGLSQGGNLLSGIASTAAGLFKTIWGVFTFPFDIGEIIGEYYGGEGAGLLTGLLVLIVIYGGFILLSIYFNKDV